jgi:hypothetical protein
MTDFYVLFENHTDGMALYRYCRERGLRIRISPAPRAASVCCGMSLLVSTEEIDRVRDCIGESKIPVLKVVELERQINPKRDIYC